MRLIVARCVIDYEGRLSTHLPEGLRLIMVKADGCVSVHADVGAYKPINWMNAPNTLTINSPTDSSPTDSPSTQTDDTWEITNSKDERLVIVFKQIVSDVEHDFDRNPGLQKDGVEAHLQQLLAEAPQYLEQGFKLIRREHPTQVGPVDLLCLDAAGNPVAVEIKRRGEIDSVEQLSRYLEFMRDEPNLEAVRGMLAAQEIRPQAKELAQKRGIAWCEIDYEELQGLESSRPRLF